MQVNLGVIDENPSSISGVIRIMDKLHQHVPSCGSTGTFDILCHGDGLSVERMIDAQRARNTGHTSQERLTGLLPVPQEFHKRGLMLQVCIAII